MSSYIDSMLTLTRTPSGGWDIFIMFIIGDSNIRQAGEYVHDICRQN